VRAAGCCYFRSDSRYVRVAVNERLSWSDFKAGINSVRNRVEGVARYAL
jgi:hypothetical protein